MTFYLVQDMILSKFYRFAPQPLSYCISRHLLHNFIFIRVFEEKLKKSLKLLFLLEPLAGTIMCGLYVQLCMT